MANLVVDSKNDLDDVFAGSHDLLHSHFVGPRQFRFLGNAVPVVGTVLGETKDSFLVAMPVMIVREGITCLVVVNPGPNPYIRLMKSAVGFVAAPTEADIDAYLGFLVEAAPSEFPGLLDMIGQKAV